MVGCNSIETPNIYPNLDDQQEFRLNTINEIKYDFVAEIKDSKWVNGLVNILLLLTILISHLLFYL